MLFDERERMILTPGRKVTIASIARAINQETVNSKIQAQFSQCAKLIGNLARQVIVVQMQNFQVREETK
jgi:predicted thioesterase